VPSACFWKPGRKGEKASSSEMTRIANENNGIEISGSWRINDNFKVFDVFLSYSPLFFISK